MVSVRHSPLLPAAGWFVHPVLLIYYSDMVNVSKANGGQMYNEESLPPEQKSMFS